MTTPTLYRAHYPDGSTRVITADEAAALRDSPYGHTILIEPINP